MSTKKPTKITKAIDDESLDALIIPKGKSIAHNVINNDRAVFCSFVLEHGGEYCGIIQVSAQLFCINNFHANPKVEHISNKFNKYVRPPNSAIWDQNTTAVHHLSSNSPQILSADPINQAWSDFNNFINSNLHHEEKCIMIAYNGEACNLRLLWKLTQAPNSTLSMPTKIYKSCVLHPSKSKLESFRLTTVYHHITGTPLQGAHDSVIDVQAQSTVVTSSQFIKFIDKSQSIRSIEDIFSRCDKLEMTKKMEPLRLVHLPWKEVSRENNITWEPLGIDSYEGAEAGGRCKPSSKIMEVARTTKSLASIFLFIFPLKLIEYIAKLTRPQTIFCTLTQKQP